MANAVNNVAVGEQTGQWFRGAAYNTLIGYHTGQNYMDDSSNTHVGASSAGGHGSSGDNTGVGFWHMPNATTAAQITAIGARTGQGITTASNVTLLGRAVGQTTLATGSNVILIGSGGVTVDAPLAGTSNYINIENVMTVTGSNVPATSVTQFAGTLSTAHGLADASYIPTAPTTGFNSLIPNGCSTYLMVPAGTLAAGTLKSAR